MRWFSGHYHHTTVCHRTDTRLCCLLAVCTSVSWLKANTSSRCGVYPCVPQKRGHSTQRRLHEVKQVMSSGSRAALSALLTELSDVTRGWITLCILLEFEMGRKRRSFLLHRPLLSVWCWHPHRAERKRRQQVVFLLRKYPLSLEQNRTETRRGQLSCSEYSISLIYNRLLEPRLSWCLGGTFSMMWPWRSSSDVHQTDLFPKFVAWPQAKVVESLWFFICCHVPMWKAQKPSLQ